MFFNSRIVLVDDKPEHLECLSNTLNALGMDCHPRLYNDEYVAQWKAMLGLRLLFLDLNLTSGATFNDGNTTALAAIADVITKLVPEDAGPYGIILWAEEPNASALQNFLIERLGPSDGRRLPVFVTSLRKSDYINVTSGTAKNVAQLKIDIKDRISENKQLQALFSWEADVVAAMDAVLKSVLELVPKEKRNSPDFSESLGKVLFRIAQAGSGVHRAQENPRDAINNVLVPILADRVTDHDPEGIATDMWSDAIIEDTSPITLMQKAQLHSAIHISKPDSSAATVIIPSDLGSVVSFPFEISDEVLRENFGMSLVELLGDRYLMLEESDLEASKLVLVQVGAACDHAQPTPGAPILYLLGIEWPFQNADGSKTGGAKRHKNKKYQLYEWRTPVIETGDNSEPGHISVLLNCALSLPRAAVSDWTVLKRFRQDMISELTQEYSRHVSRPGVIELPR